MFNPRETQAEMKQASVTNLVNKYKLTHPWENSKLCGKSITLDREGRRCQ